MTDSEKKAWEFAEKVLGVAHEAVTLLRQKTGSLPAAEDVAHRDRTVDELASKLGAPEKIAEPAAPAYSVEERRVRGEVAERINAMLGYGSQNTSLDESLTVLQNRVQFGVLAGSAAALVQARLRDAALEEAVGAVFASGDCTKEQHDVLVRASDRIRALKSKPAPLCLTPGCEKPTGHAPPCEPCGAPVLTQSACEAQLAEARLALSALTDPEGHIWHGGNNECTGECKAVRKVLGLDNGQVVGVRGAKSEPVHDFGWALARMREGKKVRLPDWESIQYVRFVEQRFSWSMGQEFAARTPHMLATDWQVVE